MFVETRKRAERNLTFLRQRPARLDEIYDELATVLSLPHCDVPLFVEAEAALERELSIPVPGIDKVVREARHASHEGVLVFVSDTPHGEDLIAELLRAARLLEAGDRVYTSAARGASKSAGGLMALVANDIRKTVLPDASPGPRAARRPPRLVLHHVGDNFRSDVAGARVEGWRAAHRPQARLTRYEDNLEEHAAETSGLTSWLAGASRLARLEMAGRGASSAIAGVAAGVTAPLLLGFALWIAAQARQRGLKRLYFVARDGEVMLQVARPVLAALAPEVECRYLYGSRQAWIFASSAFAPKDLHDWVTVKHDVTVRMALARVALTPEEVWQHTQLSFADVRNADVPMGEETRRVLAEHLQRAPLLDLVEQSAFRNATATIAYLRQEGLADGVPSALVDVGWNGYTARAFDHLVRQAGGGKVAHLLLGVLRTARAARANENPPDMTGWLFDQDLRRGHIESVPGPNVVVEMFCAGTQGRVLHYRQDNGKVRPELSGPTNEPVVDWGLDHVRATVDLVSQRFAERLREQHLHVDLSAAAWRNLSAFWTRPATDEVRAWGSFPWEEETWPPFYAVAHSLDVADVARRLMRGDRRIRRHNSWRAGSAEVSGQPWRAMLRLRAWQEHHARRLRRFPRRVRLEIAGRRSQ